MCGIIGAFSYGASGRVVNRAALERGRDTMSRRGPDGAGLWLAESRRIGLAHRRLSIIELSDAGSQPMQSLDGKLHIVFNGEIYNYRELRAGLIARGVRFRSQSDTEVLLHLYAEMGSDMVHELRGMFAFAIWDSKQERLFLARDHFGIKPLYYADDGQVFWFSSQVKALLATGEVNTKSDPAGHVGFFLWGSVPDPYTLYKQIKSIPAGSYLWVDQSRSATPRQYFSVREELSHYEPPSAAQRSASLSILRDSVLESVRHHMVADVPVGSFLSAGVDSTTITALAMELQPTEMRTVTLAFEEYRGSASDESPRAELTAKELGTRHHTHWLARHEFESEAAQILEVMDQPSLDGVNMFFASKVAAQAGLKVALSGLGGDELFSGYGSFREIPELVRLLRPLRAFPAVGRVFRWATAPWLKRFTSPKYAGLFEYGSSIGGAYLLRRGLFMPWELPHILDPDMVREGWRELHSLSRLVEAAPAHASPRRQVAALELSWYMRNQLLRDVDWASMAHSLEVRVPLVDVQLFRAVAPYLSTEGAFTKQHLARTPLQRLPEPTQSRSKTGFNIPVREWMQGGIAGTVHERGLRGWAKTVYGAFAG